MKIILPHAALLILGLGASTYGQAPQAGTAPSISLPAEMPTGSNLCSSSCAVDYDYVFDGEWWYIEDGTCVVDGTVIDPCGNVTELEGDCDEERHGSCLNYWYVANHPYRCWRPRYPGVYHIRVKVDDKEPLYYDDPPMEYWFTISVYDPQERGPDWCATCQKDTSGAAPRHVFPLWSMGTMTDGESAGYLRIQGDEPAEDLNTPNKLIYSLQWLDGNGAIEVIGNMQQVKTPQFLVDIGDYDSYDPGYDPNYFGYHLAYYAAEDVTKSGGVYVPIGQAQPYERWVITSALLYDDTPNAAYQLTMIQQVTGTSGLVERKRVEYHGHVGSREWTIETYEPAGQSPVQTETIEWDVLQDPDDTMRTFTRKDGGDNVVFSEADTYHAYDETGERLIQRTIDPAGVNLGTTWTYTHSSDPNGTGSTLLQSVQRPDGSWEWHNAETAGGERVITEIHGWKDTALSGTPQLTDSGVHGVESRFSVTNGYRLSTVKEYVGGNLVRASSFTYGAGDPPVSRTEAQWLTTNGATTLATTTGYVDGDPELTDYVLFPDGRRDEYTHDRDMSFTPSAGLPGTPPTYDVGTEGTYVYRSILHGIDNNGTVQVVNGKSTREVLITDTGGLPVFAETWAYDTSGNQGRVAWTAWTYDGQRRATGVYQSDGTYTTTTYPTCCSKEVTGSDGVVTTYTNDVLGRVEEVVREALGQYSYTADGITFDAQAELTTTYDYATARQVTVTVSDGTLSKVTTQVKDGAGRLKSVTTGSGTGALKTLYDYGTTAQGGQKLTVYADYAPNATQGTAGTRDRIMEYFRDGSVKSVTGSTVIGQYYDYGAAAGQRWTKVATGTSLESPRYRKTTSDMLGRTAVAEEPAWVASGTQAIETGYTYSTTTGLLSSIQRAGDPNTLYVYDNLSNVLATVQDVDGGGTVDYTGQDRINKSEATYQQSGGSWLRVANAYVYADPNSGTATATGSTLTKLTAFGTGVISHVTQQSPQDPNVVTTRTLDRTNSLLIETTTYPDSTVAQKRYFRGGRLAAVRSKTGVLTTYTHDGLGRVTHAIDGRGADSETHYDASGRVDWTKDGEGYQTDYVYYANDGAHPGRLYYVENANDKRTYYDYNDHGDTLHTWGHVPYPTENVYNTYGELYQLKTYRNGSSWTADTWASASSGATADVTTWTNDPATGLLNQKADAASAATVYTYTLGGKLKTRTWAREKAGGGALTTTYYYFGEQQGEPFTGDLRQVDYNDDTPDVEYTYTRTGQLDTVEDAAGSRTFAYNATNLQPTTETFTDGVFDDLKISLTYESSGSTTGRFTGFQVGDPYDPDGYYNASYSYTTTGRLNRVNGPGMATQSAAGAFYSYVANSDLVAGYAVRNNSGTDIVAITRAYEAHRPILKSIQGVWKPATDNVLLSKYDYSLTSDPNLAADSLGRRKDLAYSGLAFSSHSQSFAYNDRNELTSSTKASHTWGYGYDPIGNRTNSGETGDPNLSYSTNALNQYYRAEQVDTGGTLGQGMRYDEDGNLSEQFVAADMNCDGIATFGDDVTCFSAALGHCPDVNSDPNYLCYGCNCLNGDINGDGAVTFADIDPFVGQLGSTGYQAVYTWDGENRLIAVAPATGAEVEGAKKAAFAYDYLGRRIAKQVWTYTSGDWVLTQHRRFVWSGWLMLVEFDVLGDCGTTPYDADCIVRQYTWGLDLASSVSPLPRGRYGFPSSAAFLEGAGGIGGLVALNDPNSLYDPNDLYAKVIPLYDGNGNVGQLISWQAASAAASILAHYEYDPYGGVYASSGDYAAENPVRFSTKYFDSETGLGYWGYRYYSPTLGRWVSRDPIGERGGPNTNAALRNASINNFDALGELTILPPPVAGGAVVAAPFVADCLMCAFAAAKLGNELLDGVLVAAANAGKNVTLQEEDALQHCIGSCVATENCGTACAAFAGCGNEWKDYLRGGQDVHCRDGMDGQRDSFNNQVGRGCGGGGEGACVDCCQSRLANGELWVEGVNTPEQADDRRRQREGQISRMAEQELRRKYCRRRYGGLEYE